MCLLQVNNRSTSSSGSLHKGTWKHASLPGPLALLNSRDLPQLHKGVRHWAMHYLCKRQTQVDYCCRYYYYCCYYFVLWSFHFRFSACFMFVTSVDVLANKDERRRCSGVDKELLVENQVWNHDKVDVTVEFEHCLIQLHHFTIILFGLRFIHLSCFFFHCPKTHFI